LRSPYGWPFLLESGEAFGVVGRSGEFAAEIDGEAAGGFVIESGLVV
jgi:hypothetical protein